MHFGIGVFYHSYLHRRSLTIALPESWRRLLMHKREITRLDSQIREKGLTLIPLRVYFKKGRVKVQLGLCKGKHTYDKRQTIQDREMKRDLGRALKDAQKDRS